MAVQGALTALVCGPLIALFALIARRHSFSEDTIREAGFDPKAVVERAESPHVDRCVVGEKNPPPPRRKPRSHTGPSV